VNNLLIVAAPVHGFAMTGGKFLVTTAISIVKKGYRFNGATTIMHAHIKTARSQQHECGQQEGRYGAEHVHG
jgi:hypothetical protein